MRSLKSNLLFGIALLLFRNCTLTISELHSRHFIDKPTNRVSLSTILKVYLKVLAGNEESLANFVKMLIKDLKKYHTLSVRTLGRLGRKTIDIKSSEKEICFRQIHIVY